MIYVYILIALILMIVLPTVLILTLKNKPKALKICAIVLSVIYFSLLFVGTSFVVKIKNNNLVIYADFSKEWFSMKFLLHNFSMTNILINLILLFPLGFIVDVFAKDKKFLKTILLSFLISIFIELYQFVLPVPRTTELTDILFNTLSGALSATYCFLIEKLKSKKFK
ncbi:MAG: VanZ family protein [Clostridia bacterium]|nr:VanZ family protein [Clostridia bacterium]